MGWTRWKNSRVQLSWKKIPWNKSEARIKRNPTIAPPWTLHKQQTRPDNFFARWINLLRILFVTSMPNATSFRIEALFIVWSKYFLSSVHLCFHELFYFFILTAIIALSNGKYCFSIYYFSKLYEMNITSENIWS